MNESDPTDEIEFVPIQSDLLSLLDRARGDLSRSEYLQLLLTQAEAAEHQRGESPGIADGGQQESDRGELITSLNSGVGTDTTVGDQDESVDVTGFDWGEVETTHEEAQSPEQKGRSDSEDGDSGSGFEFGVVEDAPVDDMPTSGTPDERDTELGDEESDHSRGENTDESSVRVSRLDSPPEQGQANREESSSNSQSEPDAQTASANRSPSEQQIEWTVKSSERTSSDSNSATADADTEQSPADQQSKSDSDAWEGVTGKSGEAWAGSPREYSRSRIEVGAFSTREQVNDDNTPSAQSASVESQSAMPSTSDARERQPDSQEESTEREAVSTERAGDKSDVGQVTNQERAQRQTRNTVSESDVESSQAFRQDEQSVTDTNRGFLSGISTGQTAEGDLPVTWGIVSWALAVGVYGGGDLVTTWFALAGRAGEANPVMRFVMGINPLLGIVVKSIILLALFAATHSLSRKEDENNQLAVAVPLALVIIGGYATVTNIGNISNDLVPFVLLSVLLLSISGGAAVALYHDMEGTIADVIRQYRRSSSGQRLSANSDLPGSYQPTGSEKSSEPQATGTTSRQQGSDTEVNQTERSGGYTQNTGETQSEFEEGRSGETASRQWK